MARLTSDLAEALPSGLALRSSETSGGRAMSKRGIQIAADVFSYMQEARCKLIRLGMSRHMQPNTSEENQDILLGQMFDKGKDAIKDDFCKIIGNP